MEYDLYESLRTIVDAELTHLVIPEWTHFRSSLRYAGQLAQWWENHQHIPDIKHYVRYAGELAQRQPEPDDRRRRSRRLRRRGHQGNPGPAPSVCWPRLDG